jgi:hypothetical protein
MAHKTYISFKTEDLAYKQELQDLDTLDVIDRSLDVAINSNDEDYILQVIRDDYLSDSSVTIHLIGLYGAEDRGAYEQRFIKRELQASLYNGVGNTKNGILGIVLPEAMPNVFRGSSICWSCGGSHDVVAINNASTIREFNYNFYIPNGKCAHDEDERYCVVVSWDTFLIDPTIWVEAAFAKRTAPIASKTRVYPPA